MRSDDRRKHKLSGFILCGLWISIPQFMTIHPTVEICQYGQKWWTYLSDIIIPTAIILMWLKSKDISIAVIVFFGREILYQNVFNIKTKSASVTCILYFAGLEEGSIEDSL